MKTIATLVTAMGVVLLAAGRLAAERQEGVLKEADGASPASISPESLAAMERLVGQWTIEGKHGTAAFHGTCSTAWAPGKHCLVSHTDGSLSGNPVAASAVIGCDPLNKEILDFGFISVNNYRCFHWTVKDPERWEGKMRGVIDGHRVEVACVMQWNGPNEYTSTIAAGDGVPENVYRLKKSSASSLPAQGQKPAATYEDFVEWGNRLEGRWTGKITLIADWPGQSKRKGDVVTEKVTYRWILSRRAIDEVASSAEGEARRFHVWDAAARQIKCYSTDNAGTTWVVSFGRDGDKWPWTVEGSLPDGTTMEGQGVDTLTSDGHFLVEGDVMLGGEKLPELHDVYKKVGK